MKVRKKRPRGFKKEAQGVQVSPLNPLSVAACPQPAAATSALASVFVSGWTRAFCHFSSLILVYMENPYKSNK
jgi:hypothetical protein